MRKHTEYFLLIFLILSNFYILSSEEDWPVLKGSYLGQKPPGQKPQIFMPGVLNTKKKGAFCTVFSPDLKEFYCVCYQRDVKNSGFIYQIKMVNNLWTKPVPLPFTKQSLDNDMSMSADGKRMIFRSWRALPDGTKPENHSFLWIAKRKKNGWIEAIPFLCGGKPVRTGYPSIAFNGNVYFAFRGGEGLGIYSTKPVKGRYGTPRFVARVFSSKIIHGDMFVAPDESYMIVSCRDEEGKLGSRLLDLYILFKKADGSWSGALNMGKEINTEAGENCPQVSPDGKYFFFNRYNPETKTGNMYWMDAGIIKQLRLKSLN